MNKPDKIWAWPEDVEDGFMAASHVGEPPTTEYSGDQTEYLLATPERELASELAEVLRGLIDTSEFAEEELSCRGLIPCDDGVLMRGRNQKARAVLAKLDKGE